MPGKLRVHELAKQLGVTSKELLATLKEQGEFVKTASSTIEPPVVRKMRGIYEAKQPEKSDQKSAPAKKPAQGKKPGQAAAKKAAPKPGQTPKPGQAQAKQAAPKPGFGADLP